MNILKRHISVLKILVTAIGMSMMFFAVDVHAQVNTTPANKIKAVFLFNFTRFVDWPDNAFESSDSPFIIGVAGNNPFGDFLEQSISGEKMGTHPIIIRQYKSLVEPINCHLLYINYSDEEKISSFISAIGNRPILTVGDYQQFDKLGGIVRFFTEEDKIRLMINTEAAKSARLKISSKLLNVAKTN